MKFSIKDFFFQLPDDLVTFIEEILNGKLHFLCSKACKLYYDVHHQSRQNILHFFSSSSMEKISQKVSKFRKSKKTH